MPTSTVRAGVYVRISQDRAGDELGVGRQREDCEQLAAQRGWTVAAVYADDDRSAYSGKPRPEYGQLLDAIKAGAIGAVVAWHPDRLHRSPRELEDFIDLIERTGAAVATVQAGELDLSTAAGRMTARVVGAVARHESEQKSERLRRQRDQMAMQGRPHGGRRPFGYGPGGHELDPDEAAFVREAVDRVLAGDSVRSIARDWNARGVTSSSGGRWTIPSLRCLLTGPRIAGLRVHRGDVVGPATWPAIVTREEHELLVATLGDPRVRRVGRPATSLLGGFLLCGVCGARLHHTRRTDGTRRYVCGATPGRGEGCGRLGVAAESVEETIVAAVFTRIDSAELARGAAAAPTTPGPMVDEMAVEARRRELAEMFADGAITRAEWLAAREGLDERLARARASRTPVVARLRLAPWVDRPGILAEEWPDLDVDRRRAIVQTLISRIVVAPGSPGTHRRPSDRLAVEWAL